MPAGRMRDRISLARNVRTRDSANASVLSYTAVHTDIPAEVAQPSGQQAFRADQFAATRPLIVRTNYLPDVEAHWQLTYAGKKYRVVSVTDPDKGRRREIEILAIRDE
jgi:SPP1 family predicted phage head-tail adaptor